MFKRVNTNADLRLVSALERYQRGFKARKQKQKPFQGMEYSHYYIAGYYAADLYDTWEQGWAHYNAV